MNDEYFMREALKEAEKAVRMGEWAIGCVVVLNGKIISRAFSLAFKTKTELDHAEILVLKKVDKILRENNGKAVLYSTYTPCPMCFGACLWYKLARVVTGCDPDESGGFVLTSYLPKFYQKDKFKIEWKHGVLERECEDVFVKNNPKNKV
jgi:tRNA(adenine34) deaminase